MNLTVDAEFQSLIPPLTVEERQQLEANLLTDGCRDPLVVWGDHGIMLDGHNRLEICRKHGIHFETSERILHDRNAAKLWIINNQLGRRNLSADQMSYLRGKQYQSQKQDKTENLTQNKITPPKYQNDTSEDTAKNLAHLHKVSPITIKRDAQFAEAVDTLARNCGADARDVILSHNVRITKKEVIGLVRKPPAFQRTIIAKIMSGDARDLRAAKQQLKRERTESQVEACQDRIVDGWFQGDWHDHIDRLSELLRKLIEATTVEGALVADPFGGVASTCAAVYEAGRRYWGCEVDPGYYAEGVNRLSDASYGG